MSARLLFAREASRNAGDLGTFRWLSNVNPFGTSRGRFDRDRSSRRTK
jgi:hypothetical protein